MAQPTATEVNKDAGAPPRRTAADVIDNSGLLVSPADTARMIDAIGAEPEGFNSRDGSGKPTFVARLIKKSDMDQITRPYRLLEKGDPNHPNINPLEWTKVGGRELVVRQDAVVVYTFHETERKLAQARADATVGARVARPLGGNKKQQTELAAPDAEGLGPAQPNISQSSRR